MNFNFIRGFLEGYLKTSQRGLTAEEEAAGYGWRDSRPEITYEYNDPKTWRNINSLKNVITFALRAKTPNSFQRLVQQISAGESLPEVSPTIKKDIRKELPKNWIAPSVSPEEFGVEKTPIPAGIKPEEKQVIPKIEPPEPGKMIS